MSTGIISFKRAARGRSRASFPKRRSLVDFAQRIGICMRKPLVSALVLIGSASSSALSQTYTIETVAGNGMPGYSGDNGPATSAQLYYPTGMAVDTAGNLYIADHLNNRVRRVSNGVITTVAGNGMQGYNGDNGPATSAQLAQPSGVAVDAAGNLYIADSYNNSVRKVSNGIITTVAGTGNPGYSGDNGPPAVAQLNQPIDVLVDDTGNLYIADFGNGRVRKVSGGLITTVAGNGTCCYSGDGGPATSAQLNTPNALAIDASGNLYIADYGNDRIRKVSNGIISTVAGNGLPGFSGDNGLAVTARLNFPAGIAVDASGNLYIADDYNNRIRKVDMGGVITTIAGDGTAGYGGDDGQAVSAQLNEPWRLALDAAGHIYIADGGNQRIRVLVLAPAEAQPVNFVPVTPCRIADTRNANGAFGGPVIAGGTSRDFFIPNSSCGIPSSAAAYSLNVAVVPRGSLGYLTVWPTGQPQPLVATLNSVDGSIKSNAAIVAAGVNGAISVYVTNTTDVILDINGYFMPGSDSDALAFYPLTPCRIADTRHPAGPFGGPGLEAHSIRTFLIPESACGVSATAQAYSLNFTAVPKGPLGYLTAWPAGQPQPLVASLNAVTGTITANAVIVPAGTNGGVDVFSTDATDLVIDINGYFRPEGLGGLSLYRVTRCRVLDTREPSGTPPFSGTFEVNVSAVSCAVPATAQAYVFNTTVVPPGPLGYITMWPEGEPQPLVSTLNAVDGVITSNMAIVPTINGSIDVFASAPTYLVLDIFGYFAGSTPGISTRANLQPIAISSTTVNLSLSPP